MRLREQEETVLQARVRALEAENRQLREQAQQSDHARDVAEESARRAWRISAATGTTRRTNGDGA
jgi:cell division protein FtsB